ncbi:hypothetical protein [Bacillus cereus]|uniref:hypothetical protein n=1 Tax=Bacillus cereus TaxID=1396 RepID=UPI000279E371|nr:hypothetical protein [Bacillus cereus]EJR80272.1 hypothetical protein IKA_05704 [Bacillus cereus VD169]
MLKWIKQIFQKGALQKINNLFKEPQGKLARDTVYDFFKNLGILGFTLLILWFSFDETKELINNYFYWVLLAVFLFLLFLAYNFYDAKRDLTGIPDFIDEVIKEEDNPIAELKSILVLCEQECDISKLKVDILKSISPIPLLVFFFGLIVDSKDSKSLILGAAIILISFYAIWIKQNFERYKRANYFVFLFKSAISKLEKK